MHFLLSSMRLRDGRFVYSLFAFPLFPLLKPCQWLNCTQACNAFIFLTFRNLTAISACVTMYHRLILAIDIPVAVWIKSVVLSIRHCRICAHEHRMLRIRCLEKLSVWKDGLWSREIWSGKDIMSKCTVIPWSLAQHHSLKQSLKLVQFCCFKIFFLLCFQGAFNAYFTHNLQDVKLLLHLQTQDWCETHKIC